MLYEIDNGEIKKITPETSETITLKEARRIVKRKKRKIESIIAIRADLNAKEKKHQAVIDELRPLIQSLK